MNEIVSQAEIKVQIACDLKRERKKKSADRITAKINIDVINVEHNEPPTKIE